MDESVKRLGKGHSNIDGEEYMSIRFFNTHYDTDLNVSLIGRELKSEPPPFFQQPVTS